MEIKEFVQLKLGEYELTDGIYLYKLIVGKAKDKSKYYSISLKNAGAFGQNIFMSYSLVKDEDGKKSRCLTATTNVGGLFVHSNDNYSMIASLKFNPVVG